MGYNFTLLDIGGGFPGAPNAAITFEEVSYDAFINWRAWLKKGARDFLAKIEHCLNSSKFCMPLSEVSFIRKWKKKVDMLYTKK